MNILPLILIIAGITVFLRAIPFIFLRATSLPPAVLYLGEFLPRAVIALLIIYCFRNISFAQSPHGAPELIAAGGTALLHIWKRSTLISIAGGTAIYMLLSRVIFA